MAGSAFYFDNWMWGKQRIRGAKIGTISAKSGDVRVKFEGDLKWSKAARGQDLIYNDSIYAGSGSEANLALGNSELTVAENTLIVLRRDKDINFLNLNYGTLFGRMAKNDKLMIDTGSGQAIEFTSSSNSQIVLRKVDGRTELSVVSGEAEVMIDGKMRRLNSSSKVVLDEGGNKLEQVRLTALKPLKEEVIYSDKQEELPFQWAWSDRRSVRPNDSFTVEFAVEPAFQKLHFTKSVTGRMNMTIAASQSLSLFYRIRGPQGQLSQVEKVNFVRLSPPLIVKPLARQKIYTPPGQNAAVEFEFSRTSAALGADAGNVWYQIAADPDFNQVLLNLSTRETRKLQELSVGNYFARARMDFGENRLSGWSQVVPFEVAPKLEMLRLSEVPARDKVLIPNRIYPDDLYRAPAARVREYLAQKGFLHNYFPFKAGSFDQLTLAFEGQGPSVNQSTPHWPKKNLSPGVYNYKYQVSKFGFETTPISAPKRLEIAMEAPRPVGQPSFGRTLEDGSRQSQWAFTPLLFARSYDVEVSRELSFRESKQMKFEESIARTELAPGTHYWRARARDQYGRIISDFSRVEKIQVPEGVPQALARNDRRPTAVEKTVTRMEREKGSQWERNGWWAWLGSGMNYVDYRQSVQDRGTVNSHAPKGPSQYFEAGYTGVTGWGGVVSYKATPGEITIANATIDETEYTWSTASLEAIMRRKSSLPLLNAPVMYGLRAGVQQHKTPFLFLDADTNLQLKQNVMNTVSLGVLAEVERRRWSYYWLMRYQFPFSSKAEGSNKFEITPTFAFDGSVGTSYNLTQQLKLGMFWYGQWHQYNFVYDGPDVVNRGFQSLFYSNIDVRLGFDF